MEQLNFAPALAHLRDWMSVPWFTLGDTPVSASRLLGLVVILVAVWWLASLLESGIRRVATQRSGHAQSAPSVYMWSRVLRYTVWIVGTLVGLSYIGFDMTSFALFGGAIGVGIGFGLQNIFSNFISGIIILLERTLKVGDFVDLQSGVRGSVREIGMRFTRITTNDEVDIIVPNSEFINGRVTNWTFETRFRRIHVPFGVAYGSDKTKVRAAALRAAQRVKGTVAEAGREPDAWLVGFGDSSLNFELVVWVGPDLITRPGRTEAAFMWAIEDELRAEGIEIPFPQRDLHVRSGTLNVKMESNTAGQP
ncbi:MAG: mechanosensitive ion channel [Betaproteobacteria bacterium]|nr:mechanosensitive ion channel [Betaproteobacteria bacterium]